MCKVMNRIALVFIALFCAQLLPAQNISVASFQMDITDLTANTAGTIVLDKNGDKCALIKVETTEQGFLFDTGSLGVMKMEQKVGEIWVYVPAGVKRLTISHQQLGVLRNYALGQTVQAARTYVLKLNVKKRADGPKTQKVIIDYTPANAMVLIDSKPYTGNGHVETILPIGSHSYIIAAEGYESAEGSFKLTESAPRTVTEHLVMTAPTASENLVSQDLQAVESPIADTSSSSTVKTVTVNGISFNMIRVEGGTFLMGATSEQEKPDKDEKPVHEVTLSSYYIGETEVMQELWQAVMGSNPSKYKDPQLPVERVSWDDCQEFIYKLNQQTGLKFSLPTEAQWEYAARGGTKSKGYQYSGSNNIDDVAWYWYSKSKRKTHDVKTKQLNELDIYNMSGNVWEWCQDWYGSYSAGSQTNPTGAYSGSFRVSRGGSWGGSANSCRVADRDYFTPDFRHDSLGLRLALQ